jgi:hypothetical protein
MVTPATAKRTEATPMLSLALAWIEIVPDTEVPFVGAVMFTVGAVVSALLTLTLVESVALLPAASRAVAAKLCRPLPVVIVFQEHENGALVSVHRTLPFAANRTDETPILSLAVAWIETTPETVAPALGDVMLTVGGTASMLFTVTETEAVLVLLDVSVAVVVTV